VYAARGDCTKHRIHITTTNNTTTATITTPFVYAARGDCTKIAFTS
jgi:hypothetical protein